MTRTIIFLMASLLCIQGFAQDFNRARIDSLMDLIDANEKSMGSLSLFMDGQEIYSRAFGYADVENKRKADLNTKYRIGSASKMFTAVIMLQLMEEGRISLGTTIGKFFPELFNAEKITMEHLLRHRSGLRNFTVTPDYQQYLEKPMSREQLLKIFIKNGNSFEPGSRFDYSNTNYVLLSMVAEVIEGVPYADILKKRIVDPLELHNTYYGSKINTGNNEAKSYNRANTWLPATETHTSIPLGAGGIVSTPKDLNIFLNALFGGKLISPGSLGKMTAMTEGYGLGLIQFPFYEKNAYGHTGGIDGFSSITAWLPDDKVAISVTVNGAAMPTNDITLDVLSILFNKEYQLPNFVKAVQLSEEELLKFPGVYASPQFPLKITVTKKEGSLYAQATGQPMFPLEAFDKNKFRYEQARLIIEFYPERNSLVILQGGGKYELTKE